MKKILIATKNKGKIAEFNSLFSRYDVQVVSLYDLPEEIEDIEETGSTFQENAALKAETIARTFGLSTLADDSGLIVDGLGGAPGIYSARYAGEPTDDLKNNQLLLENMKHLKDSERTARFICVLAVAHPERDTNYYTGYCEGSIASEPRGKNGFGYDPLFIPKGYQQTMAQLDSKEKNALSHRRAALDELEKDMDQLFHA